MRIKRLFDLVSVIALLTYTGVSFGDTSEGTDRISEVRAPKPNICFGGLEDGKLIPSNGNIGNHWRETSELGCRVDGGTPSFLPDLAPAVPEGRMA